MEIQIAKLSKQGGRADNEDVHGHWRDDRFVACLVADGAGGHGGGEVAAATTSMSVLGGFAHAPSLDAAVLRGLLERANLDVVARQAEGGKLATMRSTVVLAAIDLQQQQVAWAHSGDSRAYLFRAGTLVARTTDHSLVQRMVASRMMDEEGARRHPQRNMLLSALGSVDEMPEITVAGAVPLAEGDVILLCSDGVWEPLGDECLLKTLQASCNPSQWLEALEMQIKARAKPDHDNYTAMVVWIHAGDDAATQLPTAAPA